MTVAGRRGRAVSGFVGNGQLLLLEGRGARRRGLEAVGAAQPALDPAARRRLGARPGCCVAQTFMASGQRGWNRQPSGGSTRSGGAPGMKLSPVVDRQIVERSSSRV